MTDRAPSDAGGPGLRWRDHWLTRAIIAVVVVAVVLVGASVASALSVPGSDSLAARVAEWGRGHGLSGVIDALERTTYQPPEAGGRVAAGSPLTRAGTARSPAGLPPSGLPPISALARPAVRGEGVWRVVAAVGARPALQVAFVRPDAVHTSYTAGLAWMDTSLLRLVLHPGTQEPGGGRWSQPPQLSAADRPAVLGAFNGGFRLDAARGGFLLGGRTAGVLRDGAASLVAVRQTLTCWSTAARSRRGWTATPGTGGAPRSAIDCMCGVPGSVRQRRGHWSTPLGDRLSAATLAELLRRAGSVRAMELDINAEWTSYVLYPTTAFPTERNLLPDMQRSAKRYDTTGSRDFVAVLRRGR